MATDFRRPKAIWSIACLLVAAALALAMVRPNSATSTARADSSRGAPTLPPDTAMPPIALQADVDMLVHSRIWRGDPSTGKAAVPESMEPQRWWLMAVYGQGPTRAVIVGQTGQPERTLRPGDALPSGDRIVDITPKGVCVVLNGQRRLLPVVEPKARVW